MNITPDTNIKLLKCPLELDNKNQITFSNATSQYNYFNSLPSLEVEGSYYQRKDSSIYYPDLFDNLLEYNYCMYQNSNYSNKWFYAFITDMEYISDNCTRIEIDTDVFQTWQFDLEYKDSFIVREHTNNDTIGENLVEEDLNTGEVTALTEVFDDTGYNITGAWIGVLCDYDPEIDSQVTGCIPVTGATFSTRLFLFEYSLDSNYDGGIMDFMHFIKYVTEKKGADQIRDCFMIPNLAVDTNNLRQVEITYQVDFITNVTGNVPVVKSFSTFRYYTPKNASLYSKVSSRPIPKPYGTYVDYVPKNNKCYTYPYSFLRVSNNIGNVRDYRWENFPDTIPEFKTALTISVGMSGLLYPENYKGIEDNVDEGLPLAKYPSVNWSTDAYTNWLTQQGVNIPMNILGSLIGVGGSSANIIGSQPQPKASNQVGAINTMTNFAGEVINEIKNFHAAAIAPNIGSNANTGDVIFATGGNGFRYQYMRVKKEYLIIIDNYFSMFGYKTNKLKLPNITGRSNWNYVETREINIIADIPQRDLDTIKNMFNSGLTLWHTTSHFLDYSQNNTIVS